VDVIKDDILTNMRWTLLIRGGMLTTHVCTEERDEQQACLLIVHEMEAVEHTIGSVDCISFFQCSAPE
jgi:hypothetical protein